MEDYHSNNSAQPNYAVNSSDKISITEESKSLCSYVTDNSNFEMRKENLNSLLTEFIRLFLDFTKGFLSIDFVLEAFKQYGDKSLFCEVYFTFTKTFIFQDMLYVKLKDELNCKSLIDGKCQLKSILEKNMRKSSSPPSSSSSSLYIDVSCFSTNRELKKYILTKDWILSIIQNDFKKFNILFRECQLLVDSQDSLFGNTALHWAVKLNSKQFIKQLIDWDADVLIQNHIGLSPIDFAFHYNNDEFISFIKNKYPQLVEIRDLMYKSNQSNQILQNYPTFRKSDSMDINACLTPAIQMKKSSNIRSFAKNILKFKLK